MLLESWWTCECRRWARNGEGKRERRAWGGGFHCAWYGLDPWVECTFFSPSNDMLTLIKCVLYVKNTTEERSFVLEVRLCDAPQRSESVCEHLTKALVGAVLTMSGEKPQLDFLCDSDLPKSDLLVCTALPSSLQGATDTLESQLGCLQASRTWQFPSSPWGNFLISKAGRREEWKERYEKKRKVY